MGIYRQVNYRKILFIIEIDLLVVYETGKYKKTCIKSLKHGKKDNHLNISIPWLSKRLQLIYHDYTKIYGDDTNNLVFEKLWI